MPAFAVLQFGGYLVVTRLAERRAATATLMDPSTVLDRWIPHLSWTWPLYWLTYPFVLVGCSYALMRLPATAYRRSLWALAAMVVLAQIIQVVVPVRAPWPADAGAVQGMMHGSWLFRPYAAFPSLHVAFAVWTSLMLSAVPMGLWRRWVAVPPLLIAISTVTLKEHYVLDGVAGACMALSAGLWWRRRELAPAHSPTAEHSPSALYRLPWTAADNAMTWLEPTRRCNITCDACFATNDPRSDKSLAAIERELDAMLRVRRCDAVLIAGGEPLVHPRVVEVTRLVASRGCKPVVVTNGVRLDRALLAELKRAGLHGVTFHVDSHQSRPGWTGKSERDLNALRSHFADLVHDVGGLTCAFNTTIFPDTLDQVADIVAWAVRHPDRVHILTLICVRQVDVGGAFEYQSEGRPVDLGGTPYARQGGYRHLMTGDVEVEIRKVLPDFRFCAFLGGTVHADSLKWVLGCHVASGVTSYGQTGPVAMELFQGVYHAFRRRYLAYVSPRVSSRGRAALLMGVVDRDLRQAAARFCKAVVRRPRELLRPLYLQSLSVVQPVDILSNGEMDTCDGCPNRTYWNGRLVPACRLDEYKRFGGPVIAVPVGATARAGGGEPSIRLPEESAPRSR